MHFDAAHRQIEAEGGRLALPGAPGLGFDFVPDAVEKFAVEPWS